MGITMTTEDMAAPPRRDFALLDKELAELGGRAKDLSEVIQSKLASLIGKGANELPAEPTDPPVNCTLESCLRWAAVINDALGEIANDIARL